ncbi:uncharacterized protein LOC141537855 [Cotesia typhae]|uniref:uncharacterized protein LOC141534770 n=1 Tax=Cotesia typhae TaxID=2053667 RepID=UPI003D687DE6
MYFTGRNFEGYGTWYQMAVMVHGEKDIRAGIEILEALARPVNPSRALLLASRFMDVFGPLPPEIVEAATFFCLQGAEGLAGSSDLEEMVCPNSEDIGRLRIALIEAIFNGLVTMT